MRASFRLMGTMLPVMLLGAIGATYFYPGSGVLGAVLSGLCEGALIAFVAVRIRRSPKRRDSNPLEAIRGALMQVVMVPGLASFLSFELGISYYALLSCRAKPHVPAGIIPAFRLPPSLVSADGLEIQYGLLFQVSVPREMIRCIRRGRPGAEKWAVPRRSQSTFCIGCGKRSCEGLFGIRRTVS